MDDPNDQVRLDVGGWISGPCLSPDQMTRNQPHGMTSEEASDLFQLRCTWDKYYGISFSDSVWKAYRLGSGATQWLTADTSQELKGLLWTDYVAWQRDTEIQQ
jgi:hypothetical protein